MKKFLVINLFALFTGVLFAQRNTYVGLEIPIEQMKFTTYWNQAGVNTPYDSKAKFALNVRHDLSDKVSIETGLMYTPYYTNFYNFKSPNGGFLVDSIEITPRSVKEHTTVLFSQNLSKWEIPFRLISRMRFYKNVYFAPQIGCIFFINSQKTSSHEVSTAYQIQNLDSIKYMIEHTSVSPGKVGLSFETSFAIEFHTKREAFFKAFMTYVKGFNMVMYDQIRLTPENESTRVTEIASNGSYFSFGISYYYPISNFWKKKPEIIN